MKLEHIAFNVQDPPAVADWYVQHLGMTIVKSEGAPYHTRFLADDSGLMLVELYRNPPDAVPKYAEMHPLVLHLAFVSADPDADKARLLAAGAALVSEGHPDAQTHLVMLRDPWGLAIQLCKRRTAMLKNT